MAQAILVRHSAPLAADGLCYGRLDLDVSAASVERLADQVARCGPGRIWTSPARRCRLLAAALARRTGTEAVVDDRLQELDFGAWEGLAWAQVPRAALDRWAADPLGFRPPGGEAVTALLDRVRSFCADLRLAERDCVVITHGGPLRIMPALLRDETPDLLAPAPPFGAVITIAL